MKSLVLLSGPVLVFAQSTEIKELKFRFDPEARVRPGETVTIQLHVWGDAIAKDGTRTNGRLRETATAKVADGNGWISKPFRFQGTEGVAFLSTGATGFAQIFQTVSGQFVQKHAMHYTAPLEPGTYTVEGRDKEGDP